MGLEALNYASTTLDSPDIFACALGPYLYDAAGAPAIQATIAVDYVGGSGTMKLSSATAATPFQPGGSFTGAVPFSIPSTAGPIAFNATTVAGSPWLYATSFAVPARDVDYPAGTIVDVLRGAWTNSSRAPADWPLRPQLFDAGRPTGYPAGLGAGQQFQLRISAYAGSFAGDYTILARGSGTVRFVLHPSGGPGATTIDIAVASGSAAAPLTVPAGWWIYQSFIVASAVADPLHDVRAIMPGRAGHADDFVGQYRAQAANPYYFLPHPDLVASLLPFESIRLMDTLMTNDTAIIQDWADRPIWTGIGPGIPDRTPYEYIAALINAVGATAWWNIPVTFTPDYVTNLAAWIRAHVDPAIKVALEYSNEMWNSAFKQYFFIAFESCALYNHWVATGVSYDAVAGLATVVRPAHGLATGATVQVCNLADDGYNGTYPIAVVDPDTFTYRPSAPPAAGPAAAIRYHAPMAIDVASPHHFAVASAIWSGKTGITITTPVPHGCGQTDIIELCNAADPAFNGCWFVYAFTSTTLTLQFTQDGAYSHPMPADAPPGPMPIAPRAGLALAVQRVGYASGPGGGDLVSVFGNVNAFVGRQWAAVHSTFHDAFAAAGQQGRLINCLMWQMPFGPGAGWAINGIINHYLTALGGSFLPGVETCVGAAPYLTLQLPNPQKQYTYLGFAQPIASLTCSGGVATATVAAGHGYATGDAVQVQNASQVGYCGVVAVAVTGPTTFTYPVPAGTPSPATAANPTLPRGISCVKDPPYARELTAVAIAGDAMTCTSKGHGWPEGLLINACGVGPRGLLNPYPGNYGQFNIRVIDADTFAVDLPSSGGGTPIAPTNAARMWAWDSSAIQVLIADLMGCWVLSSQFAGVPITAATYGATIRTYEGGLDFILPGTHPFLFDLVSVSKNSDDFAGFVTHALDLCYNTYGVKVFGWFNHIFRWTTSGWWGLKEFQYEANGGGWDAIMSLCRGTPDHSCDVDVFPGFIGGTSPIDPSVLDSTIITRGLLGPLLPTRGYATVAVAPPVAVASLPRTAPDSGTLLAAAGVDPDAGTRIVAS